MKLECAYKPEFTLTQFSKPDSIVSFRLVECLINFMGVASTPLLSLVRPRTERAKRLDIFPFLFSFIKLIKYLHFLSVILIIRWSFNWTAMYTILTNRFLVTLCLRFSICLFSSWIENDKTERIQTIHRTWVWNRS